MGRRRTKNKHLPRRVYFQHGQHWFVDITGEWHPLGVTLAEMYKNLSSTSYSKPMHTMADVFDRFIVEKLPLLAPRTQSDYLGYNRELLPLLRRPAPLRRPDCRRRL